MSNKGTAFLLTTIDNPFNPFRQWVEWYMTDLRLGYDTCGLIARLSSSSDLIDDEGEFNAMKDIVSNNFSGMHIMITDREFDSLIQLPV